MIKRFEINQQHYHVHFRYDTWLYFDVYPVCQWFDRGETGFCYTDLENEPDTRDVFEEGKCLKKMQGSYCWRGVWEGRLYFTDQEYWDHELKDLAVLFDEHIEPFCKEFIREREPNCTE